MFKYDTIIENYSLNQGYCLGLESYHRLKDQKSLANHYAKLALDFNKLLIKVKNRAIKNGFKKNNLDNAIFMGLNEGKKQASKNILKNK